MTTKSDPHDRTTIVDGLYVHRHVHMADETSEPSGWQGCIDAQGGCPPNHSDACHGGIVVRQTCECGASRLVERNGRHRHATTWSV